jgi:signal transduction histidine kinase
MADRSVRPSAVRWLSGLLVSVTAVAAISVLIGLLDPHVPVLSLLVLYILAVLPVALVWGTGLAVVTSILSIAAFAYLFLVPIHSVRVADSRELAALGVFLVTAVVMGEVAARSRRVALESARLSQEQSALRRVATLVARSGPPSEVFEAVTREVGLLCDADLARMERYEEDGTVTGVAVWGRVPVELAVGTRIDLDGLSIARGVAQTGGPVRVDSFGEDAGAIAREARALGIRASVGCPIMVGGRLWGVIAASTNREEPFPPDTEAQIARFTELVATAVANAEAREELRALASEQASLRRVATLVARGVGPELVLAAVAEEVGALFDADLTVVVRFEPDGEVTLVAGHGLAQPKPGARAKPDPALPLASVRETGRAARFDLNDPSARLPEHIRAEGVRAAVAAPITVEGRLWGAITVESRGEEPPGPDTEARLAGFTELVATAIANAEAKGELTASRARIVATADQTRRRIERDLHDGAQQRLVSLALRLRTASAAIPGELDEILQELAGVGAELDAVLGDLRELSRGIHPAILSEGGLGPALRTLARRSVVPVQLQVGSEGRLPERVEVTAYYVAAEALTNVAKHADASVVQVEVDTDDGLVRLSIRDDGLGGADPARGTGLVGLKDRVEATGGTLRVQSRPGQGTALLVELPIDPELTGGGRQPRLP